MAGFRFKPQGMNEDQYQRVMSRKAGMTNAVPKGMTADQFKGVAERRGLGAVDKASRMDAAKGSMNMAKGAAAIQGAQALQSIAGGESSGDTNTATSALSGAAQGALAGSAFGAPGAIVGGVVGGVKGIVGARSARKKEAAEKAAAHQRRLADIEGQKTQRLQGAFQSLSNAFSQSLV